MLRVETDIPLNRSLYENKRGAETVRHFIEQKTAHWSNSESKKPNLSCVILHSDCKLADHPNELGPQRSEFEFLQVRQLILVYCNLPRTRLTKTFKKVEPKDELPGKDKSVLIFGLSSSEYAHINDPDRVSRVYIKHVDTTGLLPPEMCKKQVARCIVSGYLCYLRSVVRPAYLHLFACPKPALLFYGSESILEGNKKVLSGSHLISWWLSLISDFLSHPLKPLIHSDEKTNSPVSKFKEPIAEESKCTIIHVYTPCEERSPAFASTLRHYLQFLSNENQQWHYGQACCSNSVAFGVDERSKIFKLSNSRNLIKNSEIRYSNTSSLSDDVDSETMIESVVKRNFNFSSIPLFEDDPKWRHWQAITTKNYHLIEKHRTKSTENSAMPREKITKRMHKVDLKAFFQTLPERSEFHQEPSAFVCVFFGHSNLPPSPLDQSSLKENINLAQTMEDLIKSLSFASVEDAIVASEHTLHILRKANIRPFYLGICGKSNVKVLHSQEKIDKQLSQTKRRTLMMFSGAGESVQPNDVQYLVRRKKMTSV